MKALYFLAGSSSGRPSDSCCSPGYARVDRTAVGGCLRSPNFREGYSRKVGFRCMGFSGTQWGRGDEEDPSCCAAQAFFHLSTSSPKPAVTSL